MSTNVLNYVVYTNYIYLYLALPYATITLYSTILDWFCKQACCSYVSPRRKKKKSDELDCFLTPI